MSAIFTHCKMGPLKLPGNGKVHEEIFSGGSGSQKAGEISDELKGRRPLDGRSGQVKPPHGPLDHSLVAAGGHASIGRNFRFGNGNSPAVAAKPVHPHSPAVLLGQKAAVTHRRIKQEQHLSRAKLTEKTKDEILRHLTHLGQPKTRGLAGQIPECSVVALEQGASQDGAFYGDLDVMAIHHEPMVEPFIPTAASGPPPQGRFLAEYTSKEQLPLQLRQLIPVSSPFESCSPWISSILKEVKVLSRLSNQTKAVN